MKMKIPARLTTGFITVLMFVWVPLALAWEEPQDFRGLKWGTSSQEAESIIREQWRTRRESGEIIVNTDISTSHVDNRLKYLMFQDKIGDLPAVIDLSFLDDKFIYARIFFKSKDFRLIEAAFKEKYGPPSSEESIPMQTRGGARFENKHIRWNSL